MRERVIRVGFLDEFLHTISTETDSSLHSSAMEESLEYFANEHIECASSADEKTIRRLYKALTEQNYDTVDDPNLVSAISSLDANLFNLCRALIYQNFMLMRKVEKLFEQINNLTVRK